MSDHTIDTLIELLSEYRVEIPIVQRDYAQGRRDTDTDIVRATLLTDIKSALLKETNALDLNFVYGKAESDKFIPIDGQQRLTTLFLLHLYAFADDKRKSSLLRKFSYETRTSSRDFIEQLTDHRSEVFASSLKPSAEIEDSSWFIASWKHDPTIQSALTMLDDIKMSFEGIDSLASLLSDSSFKPVVFKFLEMKNLGMEDSLYIKLNSRGKPLTSFENFKARLIGQLQKLNLPLLSDFEHRFDVEWTELFWARSKESFDQTYLAFLGEVLFNRGFPTTTPNWEKGLNYDKLSAIEYETIYYTLNYLCFLPKDSGILSLAFKALSPGRNYQDRAIFHAITVYLYNSKGVDTGSFEQWIRIIKNLSLNSIFDQISLYNRVVDGIGNISDEWDNLLSYFANGGTISGFSSEQIKEEQEKAKIISADESFAKEIFSAEKHPYFSGQIRAALYLAKAQNASYSQNVFVSYWEKISSLFDKSGSKYGHLLRQALLTFGDYTMPVSAYKTFGVNDSNEAQSTPSLKRLFSNGGRFVKTLLDNISDIHNVEKDLKSIISTSAVPKNDWRYCFIAIPTLFDYMSASHLRLRDVDGEMVIVPNKSTNGYSYDVFLTALQEKVGKKYPDAMFQDVLGTRADRYLSINKLEIRFKDGKFTVRDSKGNIVLVTTSTDPIGEIINSGII